MYLHFSFICTNMKLTVLLIHFPIIWLTLSWLRKDTMQTAFSTLPDVCGNVIYFSVMYWCNNILSVICIYFSYSLWKKTRVFTAVLCMITNDCKVYLVHNADKGNNTRLTWGPSEEQECPAKIDKGVYSTSIYVLPHIQVSKDWLSINRWL